MTNQEYGPLKIESRNPGKGSEGKITRYSMRPERLKGHNGNPLRDLKAEVLSIDWEITDKVMTRFIAEVERLRVLYQGDKVFLSFLRLLYSLANYVKNKKGKAHPDAIRLLNSVYNSLEKVVGLRNAPERERERILFAEIERFKKLKGEIAAQKMKAPVPIVSNEQPRSEKHRDSITINGGKERRMPSQGKPLGQGLQSDQLLFAAIEEIKDYISGELNALRAELRQWREEFLKARAGDM